MSSAFADPDAPDVSLVLPVYNEEDNLPDLDAEIRTVLHAGDLTAEIVYVDDCSTDTSLDVMKRLAHQAAERGDPIRTRVIQLRRNYGQTAAMSAGFQLAAGRVIIPLDADGQNNPADIPRLVDELEKGYDVVSGWRRDRKDRAVSRKLPSKVANWLIGKVSGVKIHDYGCTLKAYRAPLLKELNLYGEMHRFIPLYLRQLGAKVTELVVDHRPRTRGVSKYGSRRILKVLLDLILIRFMTRYSTRPMHFFGQMGLLFVAAMFLTFGYMVVLKYGLLRIVGLNIQGDFILTPLPVLAATFFLGAVMSLFFGILAEVLVRVHYESRGARPYSIRAVFDSAESETEDAETLRSGQA